MDTEPSDSLPVLRSGGDLLAHVMSAQDDELEFREHNSEAVTLQLPPTEFPALSQQLDPP